jgi:hypothetical protein
MHIHCVGGFMLQVYSKHWLAWVMYKDHSVMLPRVLHHVEYSLRCKHFGEKVVDV